MVTNADAEDGTDGRTDESRTYRPTRRSLLALAGATGLTAAVNGLGRFGADEADGTNADLNGDEVSASTDDDDALRLEGDLDMQEHDIRNVADIRMGDERASVSTAGTGDGSFGIRDAVAETWAMRATEGEPSAPGALEIQAPVTGVDPETDEPGPLTVDGTLRVDDLSVDSWHVVDVSEYDMDPDDENSDLGAFIQDHFNRQVEDESVLYYLPEGTYTWNTPVEAEEFNVFGIIGQPQATVRCTDPEMPFFLRLGRRGASNNNIFIAENITFNIETADVAASAMIIRVDDYLHIDNCFLEGEMDRSYGYVYSVNPSLLTETGRGYVSIAMPDGSYYDPSLKEQEHPMGIGLERDHRGYLVIENSYVEGFINNGIYSSGHTGKVAIRNSTVKNCGSGMLRLGDGDYAYKCHLINDDAEDRGYSYAALWVKDAGHAVADSIRIEAIQGTPSELVRVNDDVRTCTLSNVTIDSHANQYVCEFIGSGDDDGAVIASNWEIYDSGGGDSRVQLGRIARANTTIDNWDVHLNPPSDGRRHGLIIDAPWVDITGCTFRQPDGEPVLILDDDADFLRLKDCDFKSGTLFQYSRAAVEDAIVADNRFVDGTNLSGDQINWTVRGPDDLS